MRLRIDEALKDKRLQTNLPRTLGHAQQVRNAAAAQVPNWQQLRSHASAVKAHTLGRLDHYLVELERSVERVGGKVIWASDAGEAIDFLLDLLHRKEVSKVVKSKSMTTEEIDFNTLLERAHIEPVETDLGEYIVQLAGQKPFHLLAPAIHFSAREVAELFERKIGMPFTEDVEKVTAAARAKLRMEFLSAGMGVSGVNFAVAETGTLVLVENEGNAFLSTSAPRVHVALMGIEKVIPRLDDLPVFLKLLTRSATGQSISSYVHFITGPRRRLEPDGPDELYLILLDNGRSRILKDQYLSQTLHCIRCGACLNACPVYQTIGGHAYASTYQGPIGAILTPQLHELKDAPEHPFASSLCGACGEVCPVKIEIPHILLKLREKVQEVKQADALKSPFERLAFRVWAWVMVSPVRFERVSRLLGRFQHLFLKGLFLRLPSPLARWYRKRDLPSIAPHSFRQMFRQGDRDE